MRTDAPVDGGSHAARTLAALLIEAYGAPARAASALSVALAIANVDAPPREVPELIDFVRAHLVVVLETDLGARATAVFVERLVASLAAPSSDAPPPSRTREIDRDERPSVTRATPSAIARAVVRPARTLGAAQSVAVILVDDDRVGRPAFARALVRGGCAITVVESARELAITLRSDAHVDAAIVDERHSDVYGVLEVLAEVRPDLPIVARAEHASTARALLFAAGLTCFDAYDRHASADPLIQLVRFLCSKP